MTALYDIINILPLSLLAVMFFGVFTGMPEGSITGYAVCLAFSLWIILLRSMKRKNRLRSIGIVSVFVIGLLITAGEESRLVFFEEYCWLIRIVCISAAALAAGILMDKSIWVKRAVTAALLVYCTAETVLDRDISKEAFALVCFIMLVRIAEEIQRRWTKSGCPDIREHITRTAPILLAACLAVYLIPAPDEAFDWKFAKDIWYDTADLITRVYGYITHGSEDYGKIGFSDSASFLPGLGDNDEEVLTVTVGNTAIKDIRLVGCISGDFRGREWVFDSGGVSRMTDAIETSCAVRKYAGTLQSEYLQKTNMYFETLFYNTRYIFSPSKIRLEATKEKTAGISEINGSIVSSQRFSYKDNYLISCYVMNYGNPDLPVLLDNAEPIDEADWQQTAKAENVLDTDGYSYRDYQKYRSDVYENYCESAGMSEEVRTILDNIQSGSGGRYETLKKLESYLRGFEYTTDCGALPDSVTDRRSFLDNFLLSSRKGYCMHFATAFVLMANEMGIPCRYVQGYIVRRDVTGNMTVRQSNAHAWPEAYFDNVGWVAFEPTPGYYVPVGWGSKMNDTNEEKQNDEDAENEDGSDEDSGENRTDENGAAVVDPLIFIIPSLAVISFLLVFYIAGRSVSRRKYRRMSNSDKYRYLTQQSIRLLGFLGFSIYDGETLAEFSERIMCSDRQDITGNLGFIPVYETMLYSDGEVTVEEVEAAESMCHALRKLVKKSRLRFRLLLMIKKQ